MAREASRTLTAARWSKKSRSPRSEGRFGPRGPAPWGSLTPRGARTNPYRIGRRPTMRTMVVAGQGRRPRMSEPGLRLVPAQGPADVDVLLARIARGDAGAFESLYDELAATVFGLARRVVRDPARAEDVTQEVFLEVWRKAPRFDRSLGRARTWVMTIAHRRAVDAVRRNESQKRQDDRL